MNITYRTRSDLGFRSGDCIALEQVMFVISSFIQSCTVVSKTQDLRMRIKFRYARKTLRLFIKPDRAFSFVPCVWVRQSEMG